jgi:RHS repeat-associated protein
VLGSVDDAGATTRYVHGVGLIGRENPDGSYQTYVFDGTGSTLALVGPGGVTDAYAYTPYGALAGRHGTSANLFLWHGRWGVIADEVGLHLMRARGYAALLHRFVEKDPLIGDLLAPQTLHRYAFVPGNPLEYLDPLGLSGGKDSSSRGGTIAGIVVGSILGALAVGAIGAFVAPIIAAAAAPEAVIAGMAAGAADAGATIGQRAAASLGHFARVRLPIRFSSWLRGFARSRVAPGIELEALA